MNVRRAVGLGWSGWLIFGLALVRVACATGDPLPSWNAGPTKQALIGFVTKVTQRGGPDYLPPSERIAVFDNDGTLWAEQPMYTQLAFVVDRVRTLAPSHPEWKHTQPYQAALEGDLKALGASGMKGLMELVMASHAGMTESEFEAIVRNWLAAARHPRFGRAYTELVYQPMLELLAYLRAKGFKTFIVSGGGVAFMRVFAEQVYGVPPEQVIGSSIAARYESREGKPAIVRLPELDFIDDQSGKPVAIQLHIGRRPIAAFGNSDGDFEMLEWTTSATGSRLGLIVHHDDSAREWAYDRDAAFGRLVRALDEAPARGWLIASIKRDWKRVFPFQATPGKP